MSTALSDSFIPAEWFLAYGLLPPDPFDPLGDLVCFEDPDGDELTNAEEYALGSDPLNCDSPFPRCPILDSPPQNLRITTAAGPTVRFLLTWDVVPGQTYVVEHLPSGANTWQSLATLTEGEYEFQPDLATAPAGMLRVRIGS